MPTIWSDGLTRRAVLQLGVTTAVLAAVPPWLRRDARAQALAPHFLVTFYADGGWDTTQVFDVHDPNDATDGVDVDVPGQPVSQIATAGPITYISNPATRPAVDTFFATWAGRSAVVNGINTRSTSHDQSRQLVFTGYLDPTRADFAVMAAHHTGQDLPLPHLLLSGPSYDGPFASLTGRVGGQLGDALAYNVIPGHADPNTDQLTVSALGEAYVQQAIEWQRLIDAGAPASAISARFADFHEAQVRGDKLAKLATALPNDTNQGLQLAASVANAFRQGLTTSVTVNQAGGFDTHSNDQDQAQRYQDLFTFLNDFVTGLSTERGIASASLLDETTIVYFSEFGRTPQLNGSQGKDHHPWVSLLLVGKNVKPGVYGLTDRNQEGVKVNFATGQPDDTGAVLDVTNAVAGLVTLIGANPSEYLPAGVQPFTAMIA
jgi:uncharacterized protein (DUF1501 family)